MFVDGGSGQTRNYPKTNKEIMDGGNGQAKGTKTQDSELYEVP